jgi:NADH-quinone oxidoreductase subunit L
LSVIGILLFIGAMGKSAQMPLHVWLPDSMEGPTPISALIHAATMVTAGIFMVARLSPIYELAPAALAFILVIGALTAFLMGLVGLVQHDIKRVVAYSTLSQLGYMTAALGASAYSVAIFHLMTHAFFKALLFLAAGAVIIAMHHEQDMRKMGGLRRYMPITYWTALIGSLALIGFPGFAGFYSKDLILEALHHREDGIAQVVYYLLLAGVFVTALYTFRMFFLVFHGKPRMDHHTQEHLHEPSMVVTMPLILLAIPSLFIGALTIGSVALGDYFGTAIVTGEHNVVHELAAHYHGVVEFTLHGFFALPFWLAMAGVIIAGYVYLVEPELAVTWQSKFPKLYALLVDKYGFDGWYQRVFAEGSVRLGNGLWRYADMAVIDDLLVNGSARVTQWGARLLQCLQSGYLFHYAFAMIIGVLLLLSGLTQG